MEAAAASQMKLSGCKNKMFLDFAATLGRPSELLESGNHMFMEIAQIDVKPGMEADFEKGVAAAAPLFKRAKGCHGLELHRSVEKPGRYRLYVAWATVENHTVDFRGSADFQEWRKHVGHCFLETPYVEHTKQVDKWF